MSNCAFVREMVAVMKRHMPEAPDDDFLWDLAACAVRSFRHNGGTDLRMTDDREGRLEQEFGRFGLS